jgi:predicted lysophospholipase L1 biosynthesis ABC-type transport system permease subunit
MSYLCFKQRSKLLRTARSSKNPARPSDQLDLQLCPRGGLARRARHLQHHRLLGRVQEMAIRMALGSQRSHIMRLVLFSGLKLAAIGCMLGLAGAAAASTILRSFLFHVSPFDPVVVVLTAITVFALALAASALPARRAASVDPIQALRGE